MVDESVAVVVGVAGLGGSPRLGGWTGRVWVRRLGTAGTVMRSTRVDGNVRRDPCAVVAVTLSFPDTDTAEHTAAADKDDCPTVPLGLLPPSVHQRLRTEDTPSRRLSQ